MKTFKQFLEEAKTVSYAGHDYYGSPAKKVLARRSPSSAGGDAGGGNGGGGGGGSLEEGNPLVKVDKALKNTGKRGNRAYMATISADRGGMSKEQKKEAHGKLQSAIRGHIEKGMLKMVGGPKQSGEYRYDEPQPGEEGVAKEKSYVLAPGSHKKARTNFHRIMKKLGRDAGQESILKITKVGKNKPAGSLVYTTGSKTGTSEKVGRMHMNVDMPVGAGRTKFKGKEASFVVKKDKKKDDE